MGLRFFSDIAWENLAAQEVADRRQSQRVLANQATPDAARRAADLSFAYPNLPGGVVQGMAGMGLDALTPEADQIAARNDEIAAAGLRPPPVETSMWDAGLGKAFKGLTRTAFTFFQSLYDEAVKGSTAYAVNIARGQDVWGTQPGDAAYGAFGLSPGAIAASQALRGQDVDLGTGFFAGGAVAEESERRIQAIGTKIAGTDLQVTPGRVIANTVTEPGTTVFNMFSGTLDFGANIFLDPANKLGGFVGDLRASNKFLAGGLIDGKRPTMLGRTVDDWLGSRHGDSVAQMMADTDDYLQLHGLFRKNAAKSNVNASFVERIRQTSDKNEVKQLLSTLARGGQGGQGALSQLPVGQTIGGRLLGARSAPAGIAGLLMRGIGLDDTNVTVNGLRNVITRDSSKSTMLGRLGAEVGVRALRVEDVSTSVDDFGQWLKAAGFGDDRVSHYMSQMAQLQSGGLETAAQMYGIVKAATREFGDELVKDGISKPVAKAFTTIHNSLSDYRKFWIDNAGNPQFFPGSQYTVALNNEVVALPSAQMFAEFMDHAIPLIDIRQMRKALNRKRWAKVGIRPDLAGKTVKAKRQAGQVVPRFKIEKMDGWEDLGPGVLGSLVNNSMQKVWKPLVLLRIAWPVRVIAEEQVRMLASGLDSAYNHPVHALMLGFNKSYRSSYLGTDVTGSQFDEAYEFASSLSRRGQEFGRESGRAMFTDEWVQHMQGDPDYWRGLAIEVQQLSNDPIAQRIAQALVDADETTDVADVLKPLKDEFWNDGTDLGRMRSALAVDGQRWDLVNVREAADAYIDSLYGRIVQKTGGDYVYADTVRGQWFDSHGNRLESLGNGQYRNVQTGNTLTLPERPPIRGSLSVKDLEDDLQLLSDNLDNAMAPFVNTLNNARKAGGDIIDALDPVDLDYALDAVEDLGLFMDQLARKLDPQQVEDLRRTIDAMRPDDLRNWVEDNIADLGELDPRRIREFHDELLRQRGLMQEFKRLAKRYVDPGGDANLRALDLIELSGKPELLRRRFAGYQPSPGMPTLDELADKQTWTIPELRSALAGDQTFDQPFTPRAVPSHRDPSLAEDIWTTPTSDGGEMIQIAHDGVITGHLMLRREGGRLVDVDMIKVSKGAARVAGGERIGGERFDAFKMMQYAIRNEKGDLTTEDFMQMAFNGVPVREWLTSAGKLTDETGKELSELSVIEMVDAVRRQHGAAWAGRATGPLGEIPAITMSNDGAGLMARMLTQLADPTSQTRMATNMGIDVATQGAHAWPADRMFYQATRAGDTNLVRAIASGDLSSISDELAETVRLTSRGQVDDVDRAARINSIAERLQGDYGDQLQNFPAYTKTARQADTKRLDSVVDHMFDMLMSRPTNTLSRAPAFKQFYWKRISELMPYMDDSTRAAALTAARDAGVGRGDLRSMVRAAFSTDDVTAVKLDQMADDFIKGRFKGAAQADFDNLDDVDEIAKAFALHETKGLLYDLSKKTNFFDITRNIFPFGEAWYEIITTWSKLIMENPGLIRRMQQGIEGARNTGVFYPDPSTGEEVFAMPGYDKLAEWFGGMPGEDEIEEGQAYARPVFTGRVEGINLLLNNFLPGVGPVVQMPAAALAQDFFNAPEMRWARDIVFPFGYPDADTPSGIVDSIMPAWFTKALVGLGKPSQDDERLYNNTVIDVLRAMELNGEIPPNQSPSQRAELLETARARARTIYQIRAFSQFIGPTGAQVRWDVDVDPKGEAFAYQVLATEYREMVQDAGGDRVQAFQQFVNEFGFDPAAIATAKTESIRPASVTESGLDFERTNPELFRDYPLTAYYVAPDPPDGEFNYNAYLEQIASGDRQPLTPEQWQTERNRLLGSIAYERVRRQFVAKGIRDEPGASAYLRLYRYHLMDRFEGYGFENLGVAAQADRGQFMREFERWTTDEQLSQTPAGRGVVRYMSARDRALGLAAEEYGVSQDGFANAKSTSMLRAYLLAVGQGISKSNPDFATIFQRHFQWEVEDPEPISPESLLGVDFSNQIEGGI